MPPALEFVALLLASHRFVFPLPGHFSCVYFFLLFAILVLVWVVRFFLIQRTRAKREWPREASPDMTTRQH